MLFEILCLLLRLFVCLLLLLSLLLSRSNVGAGVVVSGAHRLRLGLCLSVGAFLLVCFRRSSMAKAPINVLILPCGSSVPYPSPHDISSRSAMIAGGTTTNRGWQCVLAAASVGSLPASHLL